VFDKAFFEKELKEIKGQMELLQNSFQRLVGMQLYIEELLKKLDATPVENAQVLGMETNENKG
jgi:hypothetical protein